MAKHNTKGLERAVVVIKANAGELRKVATAISLWSPAAISPKLDYTYSGYIGKNELFVILDVADDIVGVPGFVQAKILTNKGVFMIDGNDLKNTRRLST